METNPQKSWNMETYLNHPTERNYWNQSILARSKLLTAPWRFLMGNRWFLLYIHTMHACLYATTKRFPLTAPGRRDATGAPFLLLFSFLLMYFYLLDRHEKNLLNFVSHKERKISKETIKTRRASDSVDPNSERKPRIQYINNNCY